jgi:hypothetical protein
VTARRRWFTPDRGDVPIERLREILTAEMARGRAERSARADPIVAARIHWWHNGGHGHYPDCPCGACASKLPRPEPEGVTTVSDSAAVALRAMGAPADEGEWDAHDEVDDAVLTHKQRRGRGQRRAAPARLL